VQSGGMTDRTLWSLSQNKPPASPSHLGVNTERCEPSTLRNWVGGGGGGRSCLNLKENVIDRHCCGGLGGDPVKKPRTGAKGTRTGGEKKRIASGPKGRETPCRSSIQQRRRMFRWEVSCGSKKVRHYPELMPLSSKNQTTL